LTWREELLDEVCSEAYLSLAKKTALNETSNEGCSEQSSDEDDDPVPVSTIKTYSEAFATANNLLFCLTEKGEEEISKQLSTAIVF